MPAIPTPLGLCPSRPLPSGEGGSRRLSQRSPFQRERGSRAMHLANLRRPRRAAKPPALDARTPDAASPDLATTQPRLLLGRRFRSSCARSAMASLPLVIRPELPGDAAPIERLHERAFGPGRFARTAFRLREGAPHRLELSFTALVGTLLVG